MGGGDHPTVGRGRIGGVSPYCGQRAGMGVEVTPLWVGGWGGEVTPLWAGDGSGGCHPNAGRVLRW